MKIADLLPHCHECLSRPTTVCHSQNLWWHCGHTKVKWKYLLWIKETQTWLKIRNCYKCPKYSWWHGDGVKQWLTDGNKMVMRHCWKNKKFTTKSTAKKAKRLCSTTIVVDCILSHNKINQRFGAHSCSISNISESQVSEKKVHCVCSLESTWWGQSCPNCPPVRSSRWWGTAQTLKPAAQNDLWYPARWNLL